MPLDTSRCPWRIPLGKTDSSSKAGKPLPEITLRDPLGGPRTAGTPGEWRTGTDSRTPRILDLYLLACPRYPSGLVAVQGGNLHSATSEFIPTYSSKRTVSSKDFRRFRAD